MTHRRSWLALALVALLVAACGGTSDDTTPSPTDAPIASATDPVEPTASPTSEPTSAPPSEPAPTDDTPSDEPSDDPDPGAAAACTGTDANRDFFASVATAVDWSVYCPVLPSGWFVEGGQYRLAGGGWLDITYEGPDGQTLALRQGAPCDGAGCPPSGTDLGEAAYGDLAGTLLDLGGGRYAVVVDPGANPSWTLVTEGLAADDVRRVAADLVLVEG